MNSFYDFVHKNYILALIECASCSKSYVLKLAHFDLTELPLTVLQCQEIRRLYLQCNKLATLPHEIEQLTNLQILTIDFNNISSLPTTVWNLNNLTELNLSHNPIKCLPPEIKHLRNLEILWINSCELTELPDELCDLDLLYTLGARNNFLSTLPADFYKLNIRWLSLKNNNLSHLPTNFKLPNLIHLNLNYNNFSYIPFEISQLNNMKYCFFKGNKITHLNETELKCITNIFKIDLQENPLLFPSDLMKYRNIVLSNVPVVPEPVVVESDTDSSSEDWEESLNSSEIDLSNSDTEDEGHPMVQLTPNTSRFLIS